MRTRCTCAYCDFDRRLRESKKVDGYTFSPKYPRTESFNSPVEFALFMDEVATVSMDDYAHTWH